ncbi:nucleotidyltransferase domain-containing protein [Candidatus Woesearchaeota archaeon]|nr:nucleotidyltransferase domain-containing protein [Candidatus Woesearchaeota archaeon]
MFQEINRLKPFLESPLKDLGVREYARIAKMSPATASQILKDFARKGVLKEKKERIFILYKANLENELYKDIKIFYNIRKLKDSGLIESLNQFYLKPTIIFFGSGAKGEDIEESDLDLVIISEKTKEFPDEKIFEKRTNRKLQLFRIKNLKELKNEHLINNVLNGITIQGQLQGI